jgi:ribonuclease HI
LESLRQSKLVSISLIFVPDHAGVRGNERADRLAGTAVISDGRAMDHAEVLYALREAKE